MNVLVIGDEHTYGYGLRTGQLSYINHFVRQLSRAGQTTRVEAYAHLTPAQIMATLARLPLHRYDLIVVQTDERLYKPLPSGEAGVSPAWPFGLPREYSTKRSPVWTSIRRVKIAVKTVASAEFARLRGKPTGVDTLLNLLKPYRHTVVLLAPLPQRVPTTQWLRNRTRRLLASRTETQYFSLFDTQQVVQAGEEYFLTDDAEHLNAVSHELLGRALYDYYQSAPSIVTIQSFRRGIDRGQV